MELNHNADANNPPDEPQMATISRHHFGEDSTTTDTVLSITIIENMKEEYGLFVWPCSVILAEYVYQQRSRFSGANVVELGAGTSLPGLVAAKLGAHVTLTDDSCRTEVLANMKSVCDLNNAICEVKGLSWGVFDESIFSMCPKIILGADVLYDAKEFDDLFATVTFLLERSPASVFITTYHNRSGHNLIKFLMVKWGLKCVKLIDGFSFMPIEKASGLSGNIQLAEIVLDVGNQQPVFPNWIIGPLDLSSTRGFFDQHGKRSKRILRSSSSELSRKQTRKRFLIFLPVETSIVVTILI